MLIEDLRVGDKVHFRPAHFGADEFENGIVKEIRRGVSDACWVVYNCSEKWELYHDYTSAKTMLIDLKKGWR